MHHMEWAWLWCQLKGQHVTPQKTPQCVVTQLAKHCFQGHTTKRLKEHSSPSGTPKIVMLQHGLHVVDLHGHKERTCCPFDTRRVVLIEIQSQSQKNPL